MIDRDFEASMQATYRRVDFARGYDRLPVEIVRRRPVVFGSGSTLGRVGGEPLLLREVRR